MSKVIITGINGFVGQHLARQIRSEGHHAIGVGHSSEHSPVVDGLVDEYYSCDLAKYEEVAKLPLAEADALINLAGLASVGDSFNRPDLYKQVNVAVLTTLCERAANERLGLRIVGISTGAVYDSDQSMPLTEDSKTISDGSPYAISKLLMEEAAIKYRAAGVDCVIARPFNHVGPGQRPGFLVPDLYEKAKAAIETGAELKVGNLETKRDYTDVRDVVRAYGKLALQPTLTHDIYNVCSGRSIKGSEILNLMLTAMGNPQVKVVVDQALIRPHDPMDLYGSNERLRLETNWQPEIAIEQTIKDFVAGSN